MAKKVEGYIKLQIRKKPAYPQILSHRCIFCMDSMDLIFFHQTDQLPCEPERASGCKVVWHPRFQGHMDHTGKFIDLYAVIMVIFCIFFFKACIKFRCFKGKHIYLMPFL